MNDTNTTTKPGVDVRAVLDRVACLAAGSFTIEDVREARATVERLAEAAKFADVVLNAKGSPLPIERKEASAVLRAALAAFRGEA